MSGVDGKRVRCGWCPVLLPDDYAEWYQHFLVEHRVAGGYSICHVVEGNEWNVAELTETRRTG